MLTRDLKYFDDAFEKLAEEAEQECRRRARLVQAQHSNVGKFVKAMGSWFFCDRRDKIIDDCEDDSRFSLVAEFMEANDERFGLSGTPVYFLPGKPEVYDW